MDKTRKSQEVSLLLFTATLSETQGYLNLRQPYPRLAIVVNDVKLRFVESQGQVRHDTLQVFSLAAFKTNVAGSRKLLANSRRHCCYSTPSQKITREQTRKFGHKKGQS